MNAQSVNVHGGNNMDDIDALVSELDDQIVDFISDLQGEVETLTKRANDAEAQLAEAAPAEEDPDPTFEKAFDSLSDDAREFIEEKFAKLETLETERAEEKVEKADTEYVTKARAFDGLGDPEVLGPVLRRLAEASPEDAEVIEKAFTAAAEQTVESSLYDEIGHTLSKSSSVDEEIVVIAKGYMDNDNDLSIEDARAMAWERNPELYDEHTKEQRSASERA